MLHFETVEPGTFSVLSQFIHAQPFRQFSLVGGTAFSLLYGHRMSIDLDFFSHEPFDNEVIVSALEKELGPSFINRTSNHRFGTLGFVDKIKLNFVYHPNQLIQTQQIIEYIPMYAMEDFIVIKAQGLFKSAKKDDFWDIAELLQHYSITDFVNFHREKYGKQNLLISVPAALTYFADADESEDPVSLKGQTWKSVQSFISQKVTEYLQ